MGKGKKSASKHKKSKSPNEAKVHKSGKTIPSQYMEDNMDNSVTGKAISTARNENAINLPMENIVQKQPQPISQISEENKIEVIETGDKGSAKIVNNKAQDTVTSPSKTTNVNNDGTIINPTVASNSIPVQAFNSTIGTEIVINENQNRNKTGETARISEIQENHQEIVNNSMGGTQQVFNTSEIVPPIYDPNSHVFPSPARNILAKSRRVRKKKRRLNASYYNAKKKFNNTGMWSAFPGRKLKLNKGSYSRGFSVNSGRSSRSRKKFKSTSRSSRSSRSGSYTGRNKKGAIRKMKRKYLKNILPHVQGTEDRKMIVKKFTQPN